MPITVKNFNKTTPKVGIYHNSDLGLISLSSDGSNWITIADKNLGATQVYNSGNTLSEANCGKYYQWGNNYGFPFTGSVSTSPSAVNAQNYGPGNYYSSSTFITANIWDSSNNTNLRGGETGTNEAMKGPCNTGFHIPASTELTNIINVGISLGAWVLAGGNNVKTYLKLPFAGTIYNGTQIQQGNSGWYWSANRYSSNSSGLYLPVSSSGNVKIGSLSVSYGCSIRPFKNDAVQPDDTRTVLYQPS